MVLSCSGHFREQTGSLTTCSYPRADRKARSNKSISDVLITCTLWQKLLIVGTSSTLRGDFSGLKSKVSAYLNIPDLLSILPSRWRGEGETRAAVPNAARSSVPKESLYKFKFLALSPDHQNQNQAGSDGDWAFIFQMFLR